MERFALDRLWDSLTDIIRLMMSGFSGIDRSTGIVAIKPSGVPYEELKSGMTARCELEPDNPHDPGAVRIVIPDVSPETAGYVCRGLAPQFRKWMAAGLQISGTIERKNGVSDHPQVYLFITVRGETLQRD